MTHDCAAYYLPSSRLRRVQLINRQGLTSFPLRSRIRIVVTIMSAATLFPLQRSQCYQSSDKKEIACFAPTFDHIGRWRTARRVLISQRSHLLVQFRQLRQCRCQTFPGTQNTYVAGHKLSGRINNAIESYKYCIRRDLGSSRRRHRLSVFWDWTTDNISSNAPSVRAWRAC